MGEQVRDDKMVSETFHITFYRSIADRRTRMRDDVHLKTFPKRKIRKGERETERKNVHVQNELDAKRRINVENNDEYDVRTIRDNSTALNYIRFVLHFDYVCWFILLFSLNETE